MFNELKINDVVVPRPTSDLSFKSDKVKTEYESEAGTTIVTITRNSKLVISGTWILTGKWMSRFRAWQKSDTVNVECFYPFVDKTSSYECQLIIESEKHIKNSRAFLNVDGLYEISVTLEEL